VSIGGDGGVGSKAHAEEIDEVEFARGVSQSKNVASSPPVGDDRCCGI
jgi:hypothetical protein